MSKKEHPIDVAAEIAKRDQPMGGVRDTTALNSAQSRFMPGARLFLVGITGISVLLGGVMLYKVYQTKSAPQADVAPPTATVRNTLPALKTTTGHETAPQPLETISSPPPALPPISEMPQTETISMESKEPSPEEILRERRLSSNLMEGEGAQSQAIQADASSSSSQGGGDLHQKMQPLRLDAALAGQLGDRHYLLTQGSMIDCVLETRMITTQPGMTACYVTRDIYSANGRVVLLDRGSKVIGHYQGGINQGQARIFVLWSRIETPKGIIINVDSPGTGPLGEAGLGGNIDTHFWERFGGALLLSLIDDLADMATQYMAGSNSQNQSQMNFSSTTNNGQSMAGETLKNSINIPPTLYKNQGERISIFVARDLDFKSVYELTPR
jgi:type IV secretion system protein VirB10